MLRVDRDRRTSGISARPSVRRSRCLVGYWQDGSFVLENYLTGKVTRVSPAVGELLSGLDQPEPMREVRSRWERVPDVERLVAELIEQDILVEESSTLAEREAALDRGWAWGPEARFFHFATASLDFECSPEVQRRELAALAAVSPPPSPYKEIAGARRRLADAPLPLDQLWMTLARRRTCRSFTGEPISFADFSRIVRLTWGQTHAIHDGALGDYVLKTSPSGGARHPIEVYPIVMAVEGLAGGIYHYSVRDDSLVLIDPAVTPDDVVELCSGQEWLREAAAVCVMSAVVERSMWKYRSSHAYRVIHLDAGHLGQTFHLVCTALGLGPGTTAALRGALVERALKLNGISEFPLYAAAVGVPRATRNGEPHPTRETPF